LDPGWILVASLILTGSGRLRTRSKTISGQRPKPEVDSFFLVRFGREMMLGERGVVSDEF